VRRFAIVVALLGFGAACGGHATGIATRAVPSLRAAVPDRPPQPFVAESLPATIDVVDAATGQVVHRTDLGRRAGLAGAATNAAERTAYAEIDPTACSVHIDAVNLRGSAPSVSRVTAVRGRYVDDVHAGPALSPNGRYLALIVASAPLTEVTGLGRICAGPDDLVILDLAHHTRRVWTGTPGAGSLDDLAWAPGGRRLAYLLSGTARRRRTYGTHVLDIRASGASYDDTPRVLGRGPVFWWHGRKAIVTDGTLRRVEAGGTVGFGGATPLTGLPPHVAKVSVARDRTDLLVQTGRGQTWWWNGHTSRRVPDPQRGTWLEPGW
jgi:hypothetical protein